MKDIKCPHCGTQFQVDDSVYAAILQQVRSKEFDSEIERRLHEVEAQFKSREENVRSQTERSFEKQIADRDIQLRSLENEVTRLNGVINGYDAVKRSEMVQLEAAKERQLNEAIQQKNRHIAELETRAARDGQAHQVALMQERNAVAEKVQASQRRIVELEAELKNGLLAAENRERQLRETHQALLSDKQAEIDRLKDFRLRMSTKMVGETLEQHCSILFEQAQDSGLYPDATFEKDNIAVDHSKGDFIFRDFIDGHEYVSIMFEMKNEMDATASKHRNEDFLEKLDADRRRKNCEYAILVSMLEQDNPAYESGIVDKSRRFPKMLVVRPQFFMTIIRIITERAKEAYRERSTLAKELEAARSTTMDFTKFEERITRFRTSFSNSLAAAHKKFVAATDGIDKTIEALEKQITALRAIKANFEASEQRLQKADELAEETLTVKKLTHGAPTVRKLIEDAAREDQP